MPIKYLPYVLDFDYLLSTKNCNGNKTHETNLFVDSSQFRIKEKKFFNSLPQFNNKKIYK